MSMVNVSIFSPCQLMNGEKSTAYAPCAQPNKPAYTTVQRWYSKLVGGDSMIECMRTEFGLKGDNLEPLSGGRVNRLWKCADWVVKVYDHRQVPRERAERAVELQDRAAALGLPVPAPLRTRNGSLWAESDDGMVVVMRFLRGHRRVRGQLSGREAASLGSVLGKLHEMLRNVPLDQGARPSPPSPNTAARRWEQLMNQALSVETPTDFDKTVMEAADYASASLSHMRLVDWPEQPWQMCHGDLHLDNVLFDGEGQVVGILDFDNAAPSWAGVELMMAWNLCLCSDPGKPGPTPEAALFFAEYGKTNRFAGDLVASLRAYWYTLVTNTWPAAIRYREGTVKSDWAEIFSMRYRAARSLEENLATFAEWFESES